MTPEIALILKESLYDRLIERRDKEKNFKFDSNSELLRKSHKENSENQNSLIEYLEFKKLKFKVFKNREIKADLKSNHSFKLDRYSLILSVGGDGTYLHSAFHTLKSPLIGYNSAPNFSVGFYCIRELEEIRRIIDDFVSGKSQNFTKLLRLESTVNEKALPLLSLNDILFTNENPSSSTDYAIEIGDLNEIHSSSGLWIATPSGSSGAISSSGGYVDAAEKNRFQYLVRETNKAYKLKHGFIEKDSSIKIHSLSDKNAIYIDGNSDAIPLSYGDTVKIKISDKPVITKIS